MFASSSRAREARRQAQEPRSHDAPGDLWYGVRHCYALHLGERRTARRVALRRTVAAGNTAPRLCS
jgi:hypothetical protein